MPSMSNEVEKRVKRFSEQRWILDNIIRTVGVTWNQGDLDYALFPCGIGALGDFLGVEKSVKKYDDIAREYGKAAMRRQHHGEEQEKQGYLVAARESFYIASVLYGQAQWPIAEHTKLNYDFEKRKNYCYAKYAELIDHTVRRAEIPYQHGHILGWLHLPPSYKEGDKVPCVIAIGGMDSTKEISIALHSDKFLTRGVAVFAFDGPGQYSCNMQKIYIDEHGFYAAGEAVWAWIQQQPEIDHNTMGVQGVSMGSIWGTQVASVIPTVKGCAIGYPSYEQGENRAFNMYSPSFKLRFMFMAGYEDETEFDVFIQKINSHGLGAKVTFPYLVIGGEDDDFASIESTFDVLNEVNAPKEYLLYQGEGHTLHSRPSSYAGPSEWSYIADWMCDRFKGKPMESTLSVVDYTGRVHRTPWGDRRDYEPGLPDLG